MGIKNPSVLVFYNCCNKLPHLAWKQKDVLSQFWRSEVWNQGVREGYASSQRLLRFHIYFFQLLVADSIFDLWLHIPASLPWSSPPSFLLLLSFLLSVHWIEGPTQMTQDNLILGPSFNCNVCEDPFPNKFTFTVFRDIYWEGTINPLYHLLGFSVNKSIPVNIYCDVWHNSKLWRSRLDYDYDDC